MRRKKRKKFNFIKRENRGFMMKQNSMLIYILSLGVFGVITTELGVVGVLPQLAQKFNITISQAGMLVSIFALIVAISGPFLTLLVLGINRKKILAVILFIFMLSNLVYMVTPNYELMLLFRIIPALVHALFFAVALSVAASSVSKEQSTTASAQVFAGVAIGLVLGIPLTSFLAEQFSLEVAFLFGTVVNAIAFVGILLWLPSMPVTQKKTYSQQLNILRKSGVWLNILTVTFVFAAMFSVYSYFAEYLGQVTRIDNRPISLLLMVFGLFGIIGNFLFSKLLQQNVNKTVVYYPVLYAMIYLVANYLGFYPIPMIIIIFLWGITHSGGLIVSQTWLSREAQDVPEFSNSLYLSFSNLGITIGSILGGWFIAEMGTSQLMWSGILFSLLAYLTVVIKIKIFDSEPNRKTEGQDACSY
jgi:predicted MFS family arabinose efflux permease